MMPKEKLELLYELKTHIETRSFQELVMKPLFAELDSLKSAYDCNTLAELRTVKGQKQGLLKLIDIFKGIELDIKNTKYEMEQESD